MSLYEDLKAAGVETDSHESDLFFPSTEKSRAILDRHPVQKAIAGKCRSEGKPWIEVPFAFDPYWARKAAP